jgi:hypothetical protein
MKVKIKKDDKVKEFNLINSWGDVTLEKWVKLAHKDNETKVEETLKVIDTLTDIPKKLVKQLGIKDVAVILNKVSELQEEENSYLKNIIHINGKKYGFHPNFDELTLGEYADIEMLFRDDIHKNLPELMSILYRPIVEQKGNVYTIEAYDGNTTIRAEEFKKMKASMVQGALFFLVDFRNRITTDFAIIFDGTDEGDNERVLGETFAEKWSWFGVMYRLTNGNIVNLDAITRLNLLECLTWLSYETDLQENENNKLNLDGKQ